MRIGIVLNPYGEDKPGGLARVIFEWTKALIEGDKDNLYTVFLKNTPKKRPDISGSFEVVPLGGGPLWLEGIKKHKCDVYIFNTPVLPLIYSPAYSVAIAYDFPYKHLRATNLKEFIQYWLTGIYHKWSLRRADKIIAVSRSTKDEVVKLFGINPEKVKPIYHGFKRICLLPEVSVDVPEKFFFFAGTIKERKNVMNIVKAFQSFKQDKPDTTYKLVIGGKKQGPYYKSIVDYINTYGFSDSVLFLDHINDNQLSYVYKRAEALIFPSLIEGTGNPILEAMDCGIPVITSNIFGPAELGDEGSAVLIDPYKFEEIKDAMVKISSDKSFRDSLIKRGFEQVKKFKWENAVLETLEFIKPYA